MKNNALRFVGAAVCAVFMIAGVAYGYHIYTAQSLPTLSAAEVLAASVENLPITTGEKEFRYQRMRFVEPDQTDSAVIHAWAYGRNLRMDMNSLELNRNHGLSILLSVFDEQRCMHVIGTENSQAMEEFEECEYLYDRDMAKFETNYSFEVDLVLVDHGDQKLMQWSTPEKYKMRNEQRVWANFSLENSTWIDAGSSAWNDKDFDTETNFLNIKQDDGSFLHSIAVPVETDRTGFYSDEEHTPSSTVQVQLEKKQKYSPVFELHLKTNAVTQMTDQELEQAQAAAREKFKQEMETGDDMMDEIYEDFTMIAQMILDNVQAPIKEYQEERYGRQVQVLQYGLPQMITDEEDVEWDDIDELYDGAETIEYVIDVEDQRMIAFTMFDASGAAMQSAALEEDTIIDDIQPEEFFTVEYWKNDIAQK